MLPASYLLSEVSLKGKLFKNHKYILINYDSFPYFFLNHFKKVILNQYSIVKCISINGFTEYCNIKKNENSLFYYQENKTIVDYYKKFLYIWHITDRNDIKNVISVLDEIDKAEDYYIILVSNAFSFLLKKYIMYDIEMIFDGNKKFLLSNYVKNFDPIKYQSCLHNFFIYYYDIIENFMTLEVLFSLSIYLPAVRKNNIKNFLDEYINYILNKSTSKSFFDLSTYFFQKNKHGFFSLWSIFVKKYSIDFWIFFWQEQLWFCQLFLLLDLNVINDNIWWMKKLNRWFIKYGKEKYSYDVLLAGSFQLYKLDSLYKKYQTNAELDLYSFFLLWFY